MTANELRQKRAGLIAQARAILDAAKAANRDLTAEERANWDRLDADAEALKGQYERLERQDAVEAELRQAQPAIAGLQTGTPGETRDEKPEERKRVEAEAFRSWLVHGMAGIPAEQRQFVAARSAVLPAEVRALAAGVDSAGGYLVPDEFQAKVELAMSAYAGVRNTRATVVKTNNSRDILWPVANDTSNKGRRLGENVAATTTTATFGSKTLRAHIYTSDVLPVSLQLLQDVGVGSFEAMLIAMLVERVERAFGEEMITGTGNNQPEGLAAGSTLGRTAAAAAAISYIDLVELEHSVNIAYRQNAEFLLSDGAFKVIKQLTDGNDRPLWLPGVATKSPDTILGYKFAVDPNMPTPASGAKSAYFGDFSKFLIRDVAPVGVMRLTERYAEYLQVGFLLFTWHDSMVLDAGTHPIRHLVHP